MNLIRISRALACAAASAVTAASLLTATPVLSASVTINDQGTCNWSWDANTRTLTCSSTGAPPPAAGQFTCSLAPAGPVSVGTSLPLSLSCSNGTPTQVAWSAQAPGGCTGNCTATFGNGAVTSSGSNSVVLPAAGFWTITATPTPTATPATAQAAVQANAASLGGGGPPGTGNICAEYGFSKTIRSTWDWGSNSHHRVDTYVSGDTAGGTGIGTNGILVVDFVPTGPSDGSPNLATISATGFPSPNMTNMLTVAISTSPCTLTAPVPGSATDTSPTVSFGVGAVPHYWATGAPAAVSLTPGTRYYINVAGRTNVDSNLPFGVETCVPGRLYYPFCEFRLEFAKPAGH